MTTPEDNISQILYDNLKEILDDKNITKDNILELLIELMCSIEKFNNQLKGVQKKYIIIDILKLYIRNHYIETEQDFLLDTIDILVPKIIDIFISIDKKQLRIKSKSCFKLLCF